jgi:hypothetical protein
MPLVETAHTFAGELDQHPLRISYRTFRRVVEPGHIDNDLVRGDLLTITHAETESNFEGDQIKITESPMGTVVTVQLWVVPDLGTTLLSFLLPETSALSPGASIPLHSIAITTLRKTSLAGPPQGQTCDFTAIKLHGEVSQSG